MAPRLFHILAFLCCFAIGQTAAQPFGIDIRQNHKVAQIPFELHSNLIVVKVLFQNRIPLRFILDTGSQYTLLTERLYSDMLAVDYSRSVRIYGSDRSQELEAFVATNVNLDLGAVRFQKQAILVLKEDYLNLETVLGTPIHGILGGDLFKRFLVKIDYQKKFVTVYERPSKIDFKDYDSIPFELLQGKPHLHTDVAFYNQPTQTLKLLLDTGASMAFMLHPKKEDELFPDSLMSGTVGNGLGGNLIGYLGKVKNLNFGKDNFPDLISNIQRSPYQFDSLKIEGRGGLIGGVLLKRYTLIWDYEKELLYLKKNKYAKSEFKLDRSGLVIIAAGSELNNFFIDQVRKSSPAEEAGLLSGDEILRVNAKFTGNLSLDQINEILQRKVNKRVRLLIKRNGDKKKMEFYLRDLL